MKRLKTAAMAFSLAVASTAVGADFDIPFGATEMQTSKAEQIEIVPVSAITNEILMNFFQGKTPHIALEFTEGTILPFRVSLSGEFLAIENNDSPRIIKVMKTCYVRSVGGNFLFSADLHNWKDYHAFFTGKLGISFAVADGIPFIDVGLELNQKN